APPTRRASRRSRSCDRSRSSPRSAKRGVARVAVAATAPFGADVVERLAARHEIAFVLTRPDAPAGRGRAVAPPPAKVVAERLGVPVLQPARPEIEDVETVIVAAYGLLIPASLLDRALWLNVHPSLLPRWRGAPSGGRESR